MSYWLYNRSMDNTYRWLDDKFKSKPLLAEANKRAMKAGYSYCEATEAFQVSYEIPPAKLAPGLYRNLSGNQALAMGFVVAARQAGLQLFLGSYPITPASDILHELSGYKNFGSSPSRRKTKLPPSRRQLALHTPELWPSLRLPVQEWP